MNFIWRINLLMLISILCYLPELKAQQSDSLKCNCRYNFDFLRKGVEENYVGFKEKLGPGGLPAYERFRDSLANLANQKRNYDCYELLSFYINWFKDPHLAIGVSDAPGIPKDEMRRVFGAFPRKKFDEQYLNQYFEKKDLDIIEGIWEVRYPASRIAIYKESPNKFVGVTLKADSVVWFPGQVRMEIIKDKNNYQVKLYRYDHTLSPSPTVEFANNNSVLVLNGTPWFKKSGNAPTPTYKEEPISFKQLSDKTACIKIRSSLANYKALFDSIIGTNLQALHNTENLILDMRNNGGGTIMPYDTILHLIYTHPFYTQGLLLQSSNDNIALYKEALTDPYVSKNLREQFKKYINLMEGHIGERVKVSSSREVSLDTSLPMPKRIGLIMNRRTVSAAEYFILIAKNSSKVRLFGENSRGGLDHTEIGRVRFLPCGYLIYMCPMGMSELALTNTIDNIGFSPDVRIPGNTEDWISFTQKYLESGK